MLNLLLLKTCDKEIFNFYRNIDCTGFRFCQTMMEVQIVHSLFFLIFNVNCELFSKKTMKPYFQIFIIFVCLVFSRSRQKQQRSLISFQIEFEIIIVADRIFDCLEKIFWLLAVLVWSTHRTVARLQIIHKSSAT